jgi:hypothetical protein
MDKKYAWLAGWRANGMRRETPALPDSSQPRHYIAPGTTATLQPADDAWLTAALKKGLVCSDAVPVYPDNREVVCSDADSAGGPDKRGREPDLPDSPGLLPEAMPEPPEPLPKRLCWRLNNSTDAEWLATQQRHAEKALRDQELHAAALAAYKDALAAWEDKNLDDQLMAD